MSQGELKDWVSSFWRIIAGTMLLITILSYAFFNLSFDVPSGNCQRTTSYGIIFICALLCLYVVEKRRAHALPALYIIAGIYVGALLPLLANIALFPIWFGIVASLLFMLGLCGLIGLPRSRAVLCIIPGVLVGYAAIMVEWTGAETHPRNNEFSELVSSQQDSGRSDLEFISGEGSIQITSEVYDINISPILRFRDYNFHGFWSVIAEKRQRDYPRLACKYTARSKAQEQAYLEDAISKHRVSIAKNNKTYQVRALTELRQDTYSHLNHSVFMQLRGHKQLSVSLSSMPDFRFDLKAGQSNAFISLMPDKSLAVFSCSHQDKGPFKLLSKSNSPAQDERLMIYDEEVLICSMEIGFWLEQSSVLPSPTAVGGIPQNAIEFFIGGHTDSGLALFWFTYAGTSIGKGFQTVAHKAGVYEQRFKLEFEQ